MTIGGQYDDGIIAQGGHGFQRHVAGALDGPFVVLFQQDRADEPDDGVVVREDADDVGPAFDLAVEASRPLVTGMRTGAEVPAAGEELAAYGATIRDGGAGSTKVWAGRSIR